MINLFKSHYSIGRSILTLEKAGSSDPNGADSIIDICQENNLKECYLVEDSMTGFLNAYKNLLDIKCDLRFGLRLTILDDVNNKTEESFKNESKIVVWLKNGNGYKDLIKLSTFASTEGFYYHPRVDWTTLNKMWSNNLILFIPFYDSFIFKNSLYLSSCVADFSNLEPNFFIESHDLPFDSLIKKKVIDFCNKNHYNTFLTNSVYYKNRKDFKAYLTYRCISKRGGDHGVTLDKPNIEHMSSDSFCFDN